MNPSANHPAGSSSLGSRLGWGWILFVLLLQIGSRYLPSPRAVLVVDDWSNWARSSFYASPLDAARAGLQDPNRPLSTMAVEVAYRWFGDRALPWTLLSLAANSLLLLAVMKMAVELTGRRWIAGAAGMIFALLPNLTETYHWSTQVLNEVFCGLVFYALSGWLWVAYLRRGGTGRLALSALAYGVGLFSYEAGILLPGAYAMLISWRREPGKGLLRLAPFGLAGLLYVAWRLTNAFGLNQTWHYPPHMQAGLSLGGLASGVRQILQWWAGDHLLATVLSGLQGFAALSPWTHRLLVAVDVAAVVLMGRWLWRRGGVCAEERAPQPFSGRQVAWFGLAWTGAAWAIGAASYTAPRLNVIPAIGISLLAALALSRLPLRAWGGLLFVPAVLAMMANQGTAEHYRQAGQWNQSIYAHLQKTAAEWSGKKIVLFDTVSLRRGLPTPVGAGSDAWANCGNAPLARGFTFAGMVKLASGQKNPGIQVVHDIECGARIEGNRLIWHDRYDPARPHDDSMDDVFVVDFLAVGQAGR